MDSRGGWRMHLRPRSLPRKRSASQCPRPSSRSMRPRAESAFACARFSLPSTPSTSRQAAFPMTFSSLIGSSATGGMPEAS